MLVAVGLIILGIILYNYFSLWLTPIFNVTPILLFALIALILHSILSIIYVIRDYSKNYLIAMAAIFIICLTLFLIPYPKCDFLWSNGQMGYMDGDQYSCDCYGLKLTISKAGLIGWTECIGYMPRCYKFTNDVAQEVESLIARSQSGEDLSDYELPRTEVHCDTLIPKSISSLEEAEKAAIDYHKNKIVKINEKGLKEIGADPIEEVQVLNDIVSEVDVQEASFEDGYYLIVIYNPNIIGEQGEHGATDVLWIYPDGKVGEKSSNSYKQGSMAFVDFDKAPLSKSNTSKTSQELSTDYEYDYSFSSDELEVLNVDCEACDDVTECRYMCMKGCAQKDMFFEDFSSLYGQPEIDGSCQCTCRPLAHVNEALLNKAISTEDPKLCDLITYPTKFYTRDYCYLILAMMLEDETICENVEKQSYENSKDACYSMIALAKKDINLCYKMVEEDDPYTSISVCEERLSGGYPPYVSVPKNDEGIRQELDISICKAAYSSQCFLDIARETGDVTVFDDVREEEDKAECIMLVAYDTNNISYCELIDPELETWLYDNMKEYCLNQFS